MTTVAALPDPWRARSAQPHLFLVDEPPMSFDATETFASFVVGPANRLAFSVASSCAHSAPPFDLVVLHGPPGSGKSHLLHAVALQALGDHPGLRVHLLAGADPTTWEQLGDLRSVDLLVVDDVQFLPDWVDELLCAAIDRRPTLTVVVTSDRPPQDLAATSNRLRSRLAGGLVAEVGSPGTVGREEILRHWATRLETTAPDDLITKLAAKIPGDTRALIGAFRRLAAESAVDHQQLTVAFADSRLPALNASAPPLTPAGVLDAAAQALDFLADDLRGSRRHRSVVAARQVAMFLARQLTDASYPTIAAAFGGRDHTTVIYAVEKIGAELLAEPTRTRIAKVIDQLDVDGEAVWDELQRHFPRPRPPTRPNPAAKTDGCAAAAVSPAKPKPSRPAQTGPPAAASSDDIDAAADAVIAQVAAGHAGGATTVEALALRSGLPERTLLDAWARRASANPKPGTHGRTGLATR